MHFVDVDYRDALLSRPEWRQLGSLIDDEKIGIIIVKNISSIRRDYPLVSIYIEMVFPAHNIRFIAISNNLVIENQICK